MPRSARAVIGGMALATVATLLVLPAVFTLILKRASSQSPSLDPDDPASTHFDPMHEAAGEAIARRVPGRGRQMAAPHVPTDENSPAPEPRT